MITDDVIKGFFDESNIDYVSRGDGTYVIPEANVIIDTSIKGISTADFFSKATVIKVTTPEDLQTISLNLLLSDARRKG